MLNASSDVISDDAAVAPGEEGPSLGHVALQVQLGLLGVTGTAGNAVVLFVFSRTKEELVSTVFIIALACVDLATCLVVIPLTMYMEHVDFRTSNDLLCKSYEFLITSHIPFSALVMVCIAVDRYVCICHPLAKLFTIARARAVTALTAVLAAVLGLLASLTYGVYTVKQTVPEYLVGDLTGDSNNASVLLQNDNSLDYSCGPPNCTTPSIDVPFLSQGPTDRVALMEAYCRHLINIVRDKFGKAAAAALECPTVTVNYTGHCRPTEVLLSDRFLIRYGMCYHAVFATCLALAFVLYALIYRSVLRHRAGQQKRRSKCLEMVVFVNQQGTASQSEQRRESMATDAARRPSNGWCRERIDSFFSEAARRSYARYRANAKTAAMLFVVTVVFGLSYMPALLILLGLFSHQNNLFYLYFANNASNPVIYSFMNRNFRDNLKAALKKLRRNHRRL